MAFYVINTNIDKIGKWTFFLSVQYPFGLFCDYKQGRSEVILVAQSGSARRGEALFWCSSEIFYCHCDRAKKKKKTRV